MIPTDDNNCLLDPVAFMKRFPDKDSFMEWGRGYIINELKEFIMVFVNYEMYEQAALLQKVIDEKVDKMLEGLGFADN